MDQWKGRIAVQSHRALARLTDASCDSFRYCISPDDLGLRRQFLHHQDNSVT